MRRPWLLAVPLLVLAALAGIAAAAPADPATTTGATALVARVSLPDGTGSASDALAAPPTAAGGGAFAYPEDGSVLRVGASTANATAQPGISSSAEGAVDALAVSVFGGEILAETVRARAGAAAGAGGATRDVSASSVEGLVVLGTPVAAAAGTQVALADWGTLDVLTTSGATTDGDAPRADSAVTGLRVRLIAEHAGLPAGTQLDVAVVTARAVAEKPVVSSPAPVPTKPVAAPRPTPAPDAPSEPGASIPGAPPEVVRVAPEVTARLSRGGYVFPVYGPASFGDTFGASRPNVSGGWHHGEDIVAPLGTPLLAVADGTLFSVGWNDIGGWRLWLRDAQGNEFYYAHLSAYAPVAVDGARVQAGDVLGFVGKSGDAEASIPHLHFEIHPVSLLALGYDGAVAPYPFLVAWRRADDVSFDTGRRYGMPGTPVARARSGAVLLEASDISRASGLRPGALGRALDPGAARAATAPSGSPQSP